MTRRPLSELNDWELVDDDQDVRGRALLDEAGRPLGTVREMIVDTDEERVDAIVLDDGRELPAGAFRIRDGRPVLFRAPTAGAAEGAETVPLREERLQVRKRPVEAGAVEVGKEVVSEQRTLEVPVTREEAVVERRPVERRPADRPIGEGEQISLPLREERVEVEKTPVVYEEVEVGRRPVTETERVSGTVRREVAEVEAEGDVEIDERRGR